MTAQNTRETSLISTELAPLQQALPKQPILVVGQTPPPFGGQAVMIAMLLDGRYEGIELVHVRMDFSKEMNEMGRLKLSKLTSLLRIVSDIYRQKLRTGAKVLYYPPSGPRFFPVVRDIAILLSTRWMFRKVIFHFHATGLSEFRGKLPAPLRLLYDWGFRKPDVSIRLAASATSEGSALGTKSEYIVANGIADAAGAEIVRGPRPGQPLNLLFVAVLVEDKGILVMLEAFCRLCALGYDVRLTCMGKWDSPELEARARRILDDAGCADKVEFPGVLTGDKKWERYRAADLFCFPTFFHSETFPVVLLEAMCFSLPIVTTRWRGIPDVVEEGSNALLVDTHDSAACAAALQTVLDDGIRREQMAEASRRRFLEKFTAEAHWRAMQKIFTEVVTSA